MEIHGCYVMDPKGDFGNHLLGGWKCTLGFRQLASGGFTDSGAGGFSAVGSEEFRAHGSPKVKACRTPRSF